MEEDEPISSEQGESDDEMKPLSEESESMEDPDNVTTEQTTIKILPRIEKQIDKLEDGMAKAKQWQMGGEIRAQQRPANSLLEEDLNFQLATKLPIVHTPEMLEKLESVIKQRILDQLYDDPSDKKERVREKEQESLNYTKSTLGLGASNAYGI